MPATPTSPGDHGGEIPDGAATIGGAAPPRTPGSAPEAPAGCPDCGERLAFRLDLSSLAADATAPLDTAVGRLADPFEVRVRPLLAGDAREAAGARRLPGERTAPACGGGAPPAGLPEEVIGGIAGALAAAGVRAEGLVDLDCPACGAALSPVLDAGELLRSGIRVLAASLREEVDARARACDGSEREAPARGSPPERPAPAPPPAPVTARWAPPPAAPATAGRGRG